MIVKVAQWIGTRIKQEDAYVVKHFREGVLAVVCDGMGGHHDGALASSMVAESYLRSFERNDELPMPQRMRTALNDANESVRESFEQRGVYGGTTIVAAFAGSGVLRWVSVGDTALYLWRRERLIRLNQDHSFRDVYRKYIGAGMTAQEALRRGHVLRSAVTGEPLDLVDAPAIPYPLLPGDRIILASDGVEDILAPELLTSVGRNILNTREGSLPVALIEACQALDDPYADNTTVVSIDV
ncbi:MAG: serine/threonine-protein phosphatase [Akkermansia sp.]|nr:serine/threonine-protein phosphatase [Akkermansia sp.]MBR2314244.1 serine/threonine-protein phosphatase [Akkermansia sp.]